jgi:predicted glycosyltransferase
MKNDTFLFELGHPKHYHMFKVLMNHYQSKEIDIVVVARNKDVLLKLLDADKVKYFILGPHKDGMFNKLMITPYLLVNYLKLLLAKKPKLIFSKASPYASTLSKLVGSKHIIFPDSDGFKSNDLLMKFATIVVTPKNYKNNYGEKHKRISDFFENLYLHPDVFVPDRNKLKKYSIDPDSKYAIVRLVGWGAHHDSFEKGFGFKQRETLVETLSRYARVYVTSEKELTKELKKYKLHIDPEDIHHVLYYASLYIGDSQTMATEASLLGVPAVRVNSFVGDNDMTNFKLLENRYQLLLNYSNTNINDAIDKSIELLSDYSTKQQWKAKRKKYYQENKNIFKEIIEIIDTVHYTSR